MLAAPSTIRDPPLTVRKRGDDSSKPLRARTWATDGEVLELVHEAHQRLRPGKRFYRNLANHCVQAYRELVKWEAQTPAERDGRRVVSLHHITCNLYDVDRSEFDAVENKSRQLRSSWLPILREAGLVDYVTALDGAGRPVGIKFVLTGDTLADVGRDSSVGEALADWVRRAETRQERQTRRVRPWCRRVGQTNARNVLGPSVGRYARRGGSAECSPSSSGSGDFSGPGSPEDYVLWRQRGGAVRACASPGQEAGCAGLSDAQRPPWWLDRIAALDARLVDEASREGGLDELALLVAEGAPIEAAVCAAWRAVWQSPALMSRRAMLELRNARRVIERCCSLPEPANGGDRATAWLLADLAEYFDDHRAGRGLAKTPPASVGFFVRRLRREARVERRGWRARRRYAAEGRT
jgi:hypothetical protein